MTVLTPVVNFPEHRSSVPRAGSSLIASIERRAIHVRAAVSSIYLAITNAGVTDEYWSTALASRWREEPLAMSESPELQAAWAIVSMRIVGRCVGQLDAESTLRDAELWFWGSVEAPSMLSDNIVGAVAKGAIKDLEAFEYDADFSDLLPYILDAVGPGNRASVMRNADTLQARKTKKASGIFYTPTDVAEYITREAIENLPGKSTHNTVLDPACGSGVFLRAALNILCEREGSDPLTIVEENLFGIDINPLAIEAACFVLLHDCLQFGSTENSPWNVWHRIRCNFCVLDSLTVVRSEEPRTHRVGSDLINLRDRLEFGYVPQAKSSIKIEDEAALFRSGIELSSFFPALEEGANIVIGNPPYATMGDRSDLASLEYRFRSLSSGRVVNSDLYPIFLEMMWRLGRDDRRSAGMVVPLSIAYSSRTQMVACRRAMMTTGGNWKFAFFDREPHALFGEEVKTRNAIVFHTRVQCGSNDNSSTIETGPLRKWTSRQRPKLFDSIDFTPFHSGGIITGIPKLDGSNAAGVFESISRVKSKLSNSSVQIGSCQPEDAGLDPTNPRVFVAGTAYNFLNVFRPHISLPDQRAPWSQSTLITLHFADDRIASAATALLSSKLAYWLWHVMEDGFHVTRKFVSSLPFPSEPAIERLAELGGELWGELQNDQIVSVNGGRQTVAYRPHRCNRIRDDIDALLIENFGIEDSFLDYLRVFFRSTVTVDENDKARRRFTDQLRDSEVLT